jgi:hypothetical protein
VSDDADLDKRRRQRFSAFEDHLASASLQALEQVDAILLDSIAGYAEDAGKSENNAGPLLSSFAALVRAAAAARREEPSESCDRLSESIDEQLNVMTPTVLERVTATLADAAIQHRAEHGLRENDVLALLDGLTGVVDGEHRVQLTRAVELEAELLEILDDDDA